MDLALAVLVTLCAIGAVHSLSTSPSEYFKDAVFVARTTDLTTSADPVPFDYVGVNVAKSYDRRGHSFYAAKSGVYWVSFSAGSVTSFSNNLSYELRNSTHLFSDLFRLSNGHNGLDTLGRDIIVSMNQLEAIRMKSHYSSGMYSDDGKQTSLSIFRLSNLMQTSVYFSATRISHCNCTPGDILSFPKVIVDEGSSFDNTSFTVPKTGTYFFSFSIGVARGEKMDVVLRRNVEILCTLERNSTIHNKADMISRAGMFYLQKDNVIFVQIASKSQVISHDPEQQTAFSGFLYEPSLNGSKNAWSVARTSSWKGNKSLSPVPFEEVVVDDGSGWDKENQMYRCKVTGIYYVTVTVGAQAYQPVHVSVVARGKKQASIVRKATNYNGGDMLSRSMILHLVSGSLVYLVAEGNTAIYSNYEKQTTFTGLLLFPHEI